MCAACGSHQPGGGGGSLPQCLLRYTLLGVGLDTPLGVGLETPLARPLKLPLGCGPGDPPGQTPQAPPWVWAWRPPWPDPSTSKACWDTPPGDLQGMLGYTPWRPARHAGIPPVNRMTDRQV